MRYVLQYEFNGKSGWSKQEIPYDEEEDVIIRVSWMLPSDAFRNIKLFDEETPLVSGKNPWEFK